MYDRIDLTTVPGQDQIIASTVQDFGDVFTGDEPEGFGLRKQAEEVIPGTEPSAWPVGHFDPEPELIASEPDEDDDEDDDETENLDDDDDEDDDEDSDDGDYEPDEDDEPDDD